MLEHVEEGGKEKGTVGKEGKGKENAVRFLLT